MKRRYTLDEVEELAQTVRKGIDYEHERERKFASYIALAELVELAAQRTDEGKLAAAVRSVGLVRPNEDEP